jgi:hypothetical protein
MQGRTGSRSLTQREDGLEGEAANPERKTTGKSAD